MNKERERERCKASAEKRLLSLGLALTNTSRLLLLFLCCCSSLSLSFLHHLSSIFPLFLCVRHSSAHHPVPVLLTHTKSKLHHQCGSIQSMSVHASAHALPSHTGGAVCSSLFCPLLSFAQHLFCMIVHQQDGYCPTSLATGTPF